MVARAQRITCTTFNACDKTCSTERNVSRTMADASEKKTVEKHRAYDVKFKLKVVEAATSAHASYNF